MGGARVNSQGGGGRIAPVSTDIDLARRGDLNDAEKIVWGVVCIIWGIGPILYILVGGGELWRSGTPGGSRGCTYTTRYMRPGLSLGRPQHGQADEHDEGDSQRGYPPRRLLISRFWMVARMMWR